MSQDRAAQEQARWEASIDREAIGETLDADEQAFVRRYEAEHPELAQERAIFEAAIASLHEQLVDHQQDQQDDELTLAREAAAALERYRSEREELESASHFGSRRLWWIAGVAAAAGLAAWIGLRQTGSDDEPKLGADQREPVREAPQQARPQPIDPSPAPAAPVDPVGHLSLLASSTTDLGLELGLALEPGKEFAQLLGPELEGLDNVEIDRACISWTEPNAVVCFEGELRSTTNAELGERRLRLESGRLVAALDPLGPGQRFTVETIVGTVSAIGTVFAVELHEGRAWATVLEGQVELRDPMVRVLKAGQRTSLRGEVPGDEPTPMQADAIPSALAELVDLAELLRAEPGDARLEIPATADSSVRIDGRSIEGPVKLALAPGEHTLSLVDAQGQVTLEQPLILEAGASLDLADTLAESLSSADSKPSARKAPSAKQLAEAAQQHRMARNYPETARLYRELLERYPDSPEAANVPVRLGDLLASTGDHRGALAAYELYLERGAKQLAPEAEYGRIRALRALGREAEERAAIEAFIKARPDDYRRPELESRLSEL